MGKWHLQGNKLCHPVPQHLRSQSKTDKDSKPLVQRDVAQALAVENRPDNGGYCGDDQQAEHQRTVENLVTAAAHVNQRVRDSEDMHRRPSDNLARRPEVGWVREIERNGQQATEDLREQTEKPEVHQAEAKGDPRANGPGRPLLGRYDLDSVFGGEEKIVIGYTKLRFHSDLLGHGLWLRSKSIGAGLWFGTLFRFREAGMVVPPPEAFPFESR